MSSQKATTFTTPLWLKLLTWVAAAVTIVCFIALGIVLIGYFMDADIWPALYGAGLFGLPAGFALMMLALILTTLQRRRAAS